MSEEKGQGICMREKKREVGGGSATREGMRKVRTRGTKFEIKMKDVLRSEVGDRVNDRQRQGM